MKLNKNSVIIFIVSCINIFLAIPFAVFNILSWANGMELKKKAWDKIFIDIASNNYTVEHISKLLF